MAHSQPWPIYRTNRPYLQHSRTTYEWSSQKRTGLFSKNSKIASHFTSPKRPTARTACHHTHNWHILVKANNGRNRPMMKHFSHSGTDSTFNKLFQIEHFRVGSRWVMWKTDSHCWQLSENQNLESRRDQHLFQYSIGNLLIAFLGFSADKARYFQYFGTYGSRLEGI